MNGLRKITQEELDRVIENHLHWLNEDCEGWENMKADLSYTDLSYADLTGANLSDVNLSGADLSYANLSDANLSGANLENANLSYTNLRYTYLRYVNLRCADLEGAKLYNADLSYAYLHNAYLHNADFNNAKLYNANLSSANLENANLYNTDLNHADLRGAKNIPYIPLACPEEGSFIGYKKANSYIIKLKILEDAKRSSATTRKCRCNKARVLSIQNLDGSIADITEVASNYDSNFIYRVGEVVEESNFCEDRWNECAKGIHFFINREDAVNY